MKSKIFTMIAAAVLLLQSCGGNDANYDTTKALAMCRAMHAHPDSISRKDAKILVDEYEKCWKAMAKQNELIISLPKTTDFENSEEMARGFELASTLDEIEWTVTARINDPALKERMKVIADKYRPKKQ